MNPLRLSPIPSVRVEDESASLQMERQGFVDESVVTALLTGPRSTTRSIPYPNDLALSVDDMDFAGWQLSPAQPHRHAEVPPRVIEAIVRRAAPPMVEEPGLGSPHLGNHRWWVAGLAGVLSTMLFSLLLLTLASRPGSDSEPTITLRPLTRAKPVPHGNSPSAPVAPELSDASTSSH